MGKTWAQRLVETDPRKVKVCREYALRAFIDGQRVPTSQLTPQQAKNFLVCAKFLIKYLTAPKPQGHGVRVHPSSAERRLRRIKEILEGVDRRCEAADGPVMGTKDEITSDELRSIYKLAAGGTKRRSR